MANDPRDNEADDRAMLRKLDQEMIMNNNDERDYEKEEFNRHLMDEERDPDKDQYTRVIAFRVPVTIGRHVTDAQALTGIRQALARSWKRHDQLAGDAGPVAIIGDATAGPVHCAYCGAEVEEQNTDLWETGGDSAGERRYCTDAPDHLHAGEATTCDRCGGRLVAGEGDARYCGPCTNTVADELDADTFRQHTGQISERDRHRAKSLRLAGIAERSDPEFGAGLGLAAVTRALLALSAPAEKAPEPEGTWRQRAVEAEAALTAIGGILASPGYPGNKLEDIESLLITSGREADRLMTRDHRISSQFRPGELDILVISAAEMWQHADPDEAGEYLSARQTIVLAEAARQVREYLGEDDPA